jgi:hypothetical protein
VYRRAIANGIVEILSVYRSAVLHIEQKLLAEPIPILATVTQGLAKVRFSNLYAAMSLCVDNFFSVFLTINWILLVFCAFAASV